jgi:nicotinate dehydrogenase subunit B
VKKVFVGHDCGRIVNPDGLKNQIDGSTIQTVSRVLKEEVTFDRSAVTSLDWSSYPIVTFPETPEIAYDLIDRPTEPPGAAASYPPLSSQARSRTPCSTPPASACGRSRSRPPR